jgi:3-oxoadipate enol-lactonase
MLGACDLRSALSGIKIPTRIAVGEEDDVTPVSKAEAMLAGIPGSTLTVVQKGRHLTPIEHSGRIADELR